MKKLLAILLFLSIVIGGVFLRPPHNKEATFSLMFAGTPDEYGNQILNVTVAQDMGGVYETRGVVTSSNYTTGADLVGLINQTTKISCNVILNYSWVSSPQDAGIYTNVYVVIPDDNINSLMTLDGVDLVTQDQGWIVSYSYIWDTDGFPQTGSNTIQLKYEALGRSTNYNLTYYDASFNMVSEYFVDGSNTSHLGKWTEYCNVTSDGDILTITQDDGGETGFIAADDIISSDTSDYPFFQISITEVSGCNWRIVFHNGAEWKYGTDWETEPRNVIINLAELTTDPILLRVQSSNAEIDDYVKVDFYSFYAFVDYDIYAQNGDKNSIGYKDNDNLIANFTFTTTNSEFLRFQYTPDIAPSTSLTIESFVSDPIVRWNMIIDYAIEDQQTIEAPFSSSFTSYTFDLEDDTIENIYLYFDDKDNALNSGTYSGGIRFLYTEDYGFLPQDLEETDAPGHDGYFESQSLDWRFGYYMAGSEGDQNSYFFEAGYTPFDNLGSFTFTYWFMIWNENPGNILGAVYEYTDGDSLVTLTVNTTRYISASIGNGTHAVTAIHPYQLGFVSNLRGLEAEPLYYASVSWEKGNPLSLVVNGTVTNSSTSLNGVLDAPADLFIGGTGIASNDGLISVDCALYYYQVPLSLQTGIGSLPIEYTFDQLHQSYSFNEVLLGYEVEETTLHAGLFSGVKREQWTIDVNAVTLASYLFPWPALYPGMYIWLMGWVIAPLGVIYGVHKFRNDKDDPLFGILIGSIIAILGAVLIISGV